MMVWYEAKRFVEQASTLSMDALHIFVGAFLFLGLGLLLRRPISDPRPWLGVLFVTLLNEAADLWVEQWPSPGTQLGEAAKDVAVTMLLPTIILLTARHLPSLYRDKASPERGGPPPAES